MVEILSLAAVVEIKAQGHEEWVVQSGKINCKVQVLRYHT